MKKAYYYLFYKLYKHYEKGPSVWMSDWKASFSLDVLIYFIVTSLFIYYKVIFNRYIHLSENNMEAFLLVITVVLANYFIFHSQNQSKRIIADFDQLPKNKDQTGGWIVFCFVLFVIVNLVFSFYLMSQIDWKKYQ